MTMCDNAERRQLIKLANTFIDKDGKWTGGRAGNCGDRPVYKMHTKRAKQLGKRRASFSVAHIKLIEDGRYPDEDDQASHLCHDAGCIDPRHLVWERGDYNQRRKRCAKLGKCCCRLINKCILP